MELATDTRNATCQALVNLFDAGTGPGTIEIRTGTAPGPNAAATGTLLATLVMSDPAFDAAGTAGAGIATADTIAVVQGVANGTAGWFRAMDGDDVPVEDGSVSVTGGGGEMELNTVTISIGVDVAVTAWTITLPES
jgi:hypothetical protein